MANLNPMGVRMEENEWRSDAFRQSMVRKLEEAIKESAPHAQRNPAEMEQRVFSRAEKREDYLNLIARCILMVKGETRRPEGMMQNQQIPQQGLQPGMQQQQMPQGMQQQGMLQGMQQQGMGQGMQQQGMPQQLGLQQQQQGQQGMGMGLQQQQIRMQHQQQQGQMQQQQGQIQQQQGQMQQQQGQMQQQQMMLQMNQGGMRPGMPQAGNVSQLQQRLTQTRMPNQIGPGQQQQQQRPMMQNVMMTGNRMPMQINQGQINPNMGNVMGQAGQMMSSQAPRGPAPPYMNPSPGSMGPTSGSPMMMSSHGLSPAVPNQFIPSPGSSQTGLPSPGPRSNMAPSPMSVSIATPQNDMMGEEQAYLEKVKQLSRYIEPLSRMIAKIGNEDQEKLGKMKKLMDILSNPNKRMPMETLLKCEAVLERMNLDAGDHETAKSAAASVLPPISSSSITPLLEAIVKLKSNQKIALPLNHALHRTFGAPVEALYGSEISLPPLPKRRRRIDMEETSHTGIAAVTVPHVLQGEIARLQSHFKVSLDSAQPSGTAAGSILLVCQLEDRNLLSVPALSVSIPQNYPDSSPTCDTDLPEYSSTPFNMKLQSALQSRLIFMPEPHTLSQLLNVWEMSVRSACSPRDIKPTKMSCLMGL